jgi:hypothetical protein
MFTRIRKVFIQLNISLLLHDEHLAFFATHDDACARDYTTGEVKRLLAKHVPKNTLQENGC